MGLFNISEVFEFAIQIEETGENFYRKVANQTTDDNVKKVFTFLADQEINHKKIFQEMSAKYDKYEPPESYSGEYFAYLKSYVENLIFNKNKEKEILDAKDVSSVIDFATRIELDSILYYQDVKEFLSQSQTKDIEKIIEEEKKHFIMLSNMKAK